jgi:hypothetical protein
MWLIQMRLGRKAKHAKYVAEIQFPRSLDSVAVSNNKRCTLPTPFIHCLLRISHRGSDVSATVIMTNGEHARPHWAALYRYHPTHCASACELSRGAFGSYQCCGPAHAAVGHHSPQCELLAMQCSFHFSLDHIQSQFKEPLPS